MDLNSNHIILSKYIELKEKDFDIFNEYLVELKNSITEAFISNNPKLIYNASIILGQIDNLEFTMKDYEIMKRIAIKLPQLEISKFYDYREVVNLALDIIFHFINGGVCKCQFYPQRAKFFVPQYELAYGYITKSSKPTNVNYEHFYTEDFYDCKHCGAKLIETVQEGGHSPYSFWRISG